MASQSFYSGPRWLYSFVFIGEMLFSHLTLQAPVVEPMWYLC